MGSKATGQIKLKVWFISCLCLTMLGCGSKDDDKKEENSDNGLFLNIGHFTRGYLNLNGIEKEAIANDLLVNPIYRMTSPGDQELEDKAENDLENRSCNIIEDRIEATSDFSIRMYYKSDTRKCLGDNSDETREQEQTSVRVFSEVTCSETKIGVLHGGRAQTKIFEDLCPNDSRQLYIRNQQKITTQVNMKTDKTYLIILNNAVMNSQGGSCETNKTGKEVSVKDCGTYSSRAYGAKNTKTVIDLYRFEGKNLVGTVGERFYTSGQFNVYLNNWVGVLKYGSLGIEGQSQPPVFEFKDTTTGSKLEGSIVIREQPKATVPNTKDPIISPPANEEEEEEEEGPGNSPGGFPPA